MNITEKLLRLTEGKRQADIARAADLKPTQLRDYTAKGSLPRYDIALRIARALNVSVEWLVDDAANWPPPKIADASLEKVDDDDLMFEVCKRHRRELVPFVEAIDKAEKEDWSAVLKAFAGWKPGNPLPDAVKDLQYPWIIRWGIPRILEHDTWFASAKFHAELRGAEKPVADFKLDVVEKRYKALASLTDFLNVMKLLKEAESWTWARTREAFIEDGWGPRGRGFVRPSEPASPPAPPGAEVPAASKPVCKPSKPPSKPQ